MESKDLTLALKIVTETLEQKRIQRAEQEEGLAKAEQTVAERRKVLNDFDRLIGELEQTKATLQRTLKITPLPDPYKGDDVLIRQVGMSGYRGQGGAYYMVSACLVTPIENGIKNLKDLRVVFTCECASFRFSKGEGRHGKTCKHIESWCWARSKETAHSEVRSRLIAHRIINREVCFTIDERYRFRD